MSHTYEEIRKTVINILLGHERCMYEPNQYEHLRLGVAEVFQRRDKRNTLGELLPEESEIFLEVFWDLFRQGIITLGCDKDNREFPFFRLSQFGKKIAENQEPYFFHDVSGYEKVILEQIPNINKVTLIYLKEAMQTFLSGCFLSSSVMIGVAVEDSFQSLLETIEQNANFVSTFKNVFEQKTILQKFNKFKNILEQNKNILNSEIKENLDTDFIGLINMIRNFRNESGHPSGKIINREQCFVLLYLFIPCCKKIYQLIEFFSNENN